VRSPRSVGIDAALALVAGAAAAGAYETDQYSHRLQPIRDSLPQLDARVNQALAQIVARWRGRRNDWKLARKIYWKLGGVYWVHHLERWAMKDPSIDRLPQGGHDSYYRGAPFIATRVNYFFGVGRTIKLAGSLVGTDKLGHFFAQGVKYYGSHLRGWTEARVLRRGQFNERWLFGQATTSVYSNGDLVANYEGYRFYRSLFEDGIVPGKPAIVRWDGDKPVLQRPFTWADHVDDGWDEAANPSYVEPALQRWYDYRLPLFCDEYRKSPSAYVPAHPGEIERRYGHIGMKPAPQNRMDAVCARPR
jgi:hypothetical protein